MAVKGGECILDDTCGHVFIIDVITYLSSSLSVTFPLSPSVSLSLPRILPSLFIFVCCKEKREISYLQYFVALFTMTD